MQRANLHLDSRGNFFGRIWLWVWPLVWLWIQWKLFEVWTFTYSADFTCMQVLVERVKIVYLKNILHATKTRAFFISSFSSIIWWKAIFMPSYFTCCFVTNLRFLRLFARFCEDMVTLFFISNFIMLDVRLAISKKCSLLLQRRCQATTVKWVCRVCFGLRGWIVNKSPLSWLDIFKLLAD